MNLCSCVQQGQTPLMCALEQNEDVALALLKRGASNVDVVLKDQVRGCGVERPGAWMWCWETRCVDVVLGDQVRLFSPRLSSQ